MRPAVPREGLAAASDCDAVRRDEGKASPVGMCRLRYWRYQLAIALSVDTWVGRTAGPAVRIDAVSGRGRPAAAPAADRRGEEPRDIAPPHAAGRQAAQRCRAEKPPVAATAITISLDSAFIRNRDDGERHLEVRVGNVETVDGERQVFGSVTRAETDITALITRTLEIAGRTDATKVAAFTDGCPGLRTVLTNAGVTKPPILDWFHIAMRLQHTKLAAANLSTDDPAQVTAKALIVAEVERLHWRIWNGKAKNAQRSIKRIRKVMHVFKGEHRQGAKGVAARKLWHALHAVDKYLRGQAAWLVNYAKRHRVGLRVGTSITEGNSELPDQPADEQVPADAMVAKWRRSAAPSSLRCL
jgi:hypothetical protein